MEHGSEMLQKQDHDTRLQTMTCAIHLPAVQQLALARRAGCAYQLKRSLSKKKKRGDGSCQGPVKWHGAAAKFFARGCFSEQCLRSTSLRERSALSAQECNDLAAIHAAVSVPIFPRSALTADSPLWPCCRFGAHWACPQRFSPRSASVEGGMFCRCLSQSEISLRGSLFTWLVLRCQ